MVKNVRKNNQIRVPEVRLIDENGNQVGIVPTKEALHIAQEAGLDLVEVSPTAKPPVCKVMDYGKYLYELEKKEKEAKKKQKHIEVKEVKFRYKIGEHDYQTKLRNCIKFLEKGNKVKITMFFRGREKAHVDLGEELLERIISDLSEYGQVEKRTPMVGNTMNAIIVPVKK